MRLLLMLLYIAKIKITHYLIFKKAFKFSNFTEKSLTSFSEVTLYVCKLTGTSTSRVPDASEIHSTSGAALGVFCTDDLCLSTRTLLLL